MCLLPLNALHLRWADWHVPSGRPLPERVMNNHLEHSFVPLVMSVVPWVGLMQGTNIPLTWMSEAACMRTCRHPSAPRMRISWFFLAWMLKLSNELEVSTSFVVILQVPKMQSNLQPFQSLMSCREDTGTNIQNTVSACLTGLNHTCSGEQGKWAGGLRKPHLQTLPCRLLYKY